ncbi:dihydrouridine synthase protein [Cyclospora cayetanensis]|uniref:tRNA-dihydrouridine(16/17) synthase [NAD(P)(+)] n=1 Tax=Cyclospora cayetanensis TaxID=88456 RepID=A0A1D3D8R7_9EIME|nr:dihydrouridine synthase protein [Cyclospora cayetanensis]
MGLFACHAQTQDGKRQQLLEVSRISPQYDYQQQQYDYSQQHQYDYIEQQQYHYSQQQQYDYIQQQQYDYSQQHQYHYSQQHQYDYSQQQQYDYSQQQQYHYSQQQQYYYIQQHQYDYSQQQQYDYIQQHQYDYIQQQQLLCEAEGVELSFSPMLNSRLFVEEPKYRLLQWQVQATPKKTTREGRSFFCRHRRSRQRDGCSSSRDRCNSDSSRERCSSSDSNRDRCNRKERWWRAERGAAQQTDTSFDTQVPLIAQFCGHTPEHMVAAGRLIEDTVAAVDVNLGCPQGIARRGFYGAYLLQEPELIMSSAHSGVCAEQPPTASILRPPSRMRLSLQLYSVCNAPEPCRASYLQDAQSLYGAELHSVASQNSKERREGGFRRDALLYLAAAGAAALTLHGRTKDEKGRDTGEADWGIIRRVKSRLEIPVIANGGVETHEDAVRCLQVTGADAVMAAEAILDNPSLFREASAHLRQQALQQATAALQPPASSCMEDLHSLMNAIVCYYAAADGGAGCFNVDSPSENNTWYRRHRRGAAGTTNANEGASDTENTDKNQTHTLGNLLNVSKKWLFFSCHRHQALELKGGE